MLGVDHDKIILLSTPFPTIPMLGKNCCYNVIVFFVVGNKRFGIVLYCIVLYCMLRLFFPGPDSGAELESTGLAMKHPKWGAC